MNATLIIGILIAYFFLLLVMSWFTSRNADNKSFFQANKNAPWYLVAFGMIGTSLSGVTFISVPGTVAKSGFGYFQIVIGYFLGYLVVAYVLLPIYYRLQLVSIYNYLLGRFGFVSYKTGALFFLISRSMGAALRLFLVVNVLQIFVMDTLNIPFEVTAIVVLMMILLYTIKGGVKTIVWTDTLQTVFMLLALVVCICYVLIDLQMPISSAISELSTSGLLRVFNGDPGSKGFFVKQILGGMFITITMTGLDQEMMQKNISVKNLADSQKNVVLFSLVLVLVNGLFLLLGGFLSIYAQSNQLTIAGDDLFPSIVLHHLPHIVGLIFIVGLISALFPSADGAITALTASFCIDILGINRNDQLSELDRTRIRMYVHLSFAFLFLLIVFYFRWVDDKNVVLMLLDLAGYTYGPLLGLFAFGILTKRRINDRWSIVVCLISPALTWLAVYSLDTQWHLYKFGLENLIINGMLCFCGLWAISKPAQVLKSSAL